MKGGFMRKIISLLMIILVISLSACNRPEPMNIDSLEEFSVFKELDDYTIYKRTVIPEDWSYARYAISLETSDGVSCRAGAFQELNFVFEYNEKYYGIREFSKFKLFTCDDLIEYGVFEEKVDNDEES